MILHAASPPEDRSGHWDQRFAMLFLALLGGRIAYLLAAPLDLSPDEAYYWDWSRHLDWGYYSKPPMVAWIIAGSTAVFGNTPFGVRLPAAVLSTLTLLAVFCLGKVLFGSRAGFWAAASAAAMPGAAVLGLIMTIDAPLMFFWSVALLWTWKAVNIAGRSAGWWMLSGAAAGLGMLSKQTMAAYLPLAFLSCLATPAGRGVLRTPWPYAALALSLLVLAPILWWNHHHDWITLQHTAHHFQGGEGDGWLSLRTLGEFVGSQLGIVSPVTWSLAALVGFACLVRINIADDRIRYLAPLGPLAIAGVLLLSVTQRVNGNWPAPFYLASLTLLAGWADGAASCFSRFEKLKNLYRPGVAVGAGLTAVLYLTPWIMPLLGLGGGPMDPAARLRGWTELGERVGEILKNVSGNGEMFVVGRKRQIVSELAFYLPGQPGVLRWPGSGGRVSTQYEIWPSPHKNIGRSALIVLGADENVPQGLEQAFESVRFLEEVVIPMGGGERRFRIHLGTVLRQWPERD